MIRQYHAQRARGGDNPLRVGVISVGAILYLQDEGSFRNHFDGLPVWRTPWIVEGFLNGTMGAARRNRDTGLWEDAYRSGRSDIALVRSLRDRRIVREVAVRTLQLHEDKGFWKDMPGYPTLPDLRRFKGSGPALRDGVLQRRRSRLHAGRLDARGQPCPDVKGRT